MALANALIVTKYRLVCTHTIAVSQIKGAPCARCAHFHGQVHNFRRCAPSVCMFPEPVIVVKYKEGAWRNSWAHGFTNLGQVHPVGAPNKTLILDTA